MRVNAVYTKAKHGSRLLLADFYIDFKGAIVNHGAYSEPCVKLKRSLISLISCRINIVMVSLMQCLQLTLKLKTQPPFLSPRF